MILNLLRLLTAFSVLHDPSEASSQCVSSATANVVIMIDITGSTTPAQIEQQKTSARNFIALAQTFVVKPLIAVGSFNSVCFGATSCYASGFIQARINAPLSTIYSQQLQALAAGSAGIHGGATDTGGTGQSNVQQAIEVAQTHLQQAGSLAYSNHIILFSDGDPNLPGYYHESVFQCGTYYCPTAEIAAATAATNARSAGVQIFTVHIGNSGDGGPAFLENRIAYNPTFAFSESLNQDFVMSHISSVSCATATPTPSATAVITSTATATRTHTPPATLTNTPTATATSTPPSTLTATSTATGTATFTRTATPPATLTGTATSTPSSTPTSTYTATGTPTFTRSATPSATVTGTPTATATSTPPNTPTPTYTATGTPTWYFTITPTTTPSTTPSATLTSTTTPTATHTLTALPTSTSTQTPTPAITIESGGQCSQIDIRGYVLALTTTLGQQNAQLTRLFTGLSLLKSKCRNWSTVSRFISSSKKTQTKVNSLNSLAAAKLPPILLTSCPAALGCLSTRVLIDDLSYVKNSISYRTWVRKAADYRLKCLMPGSCESSGCLERAQLRKRLADQEKRNAATLHQRNVDLLKIIPRQTFNCTRN